MRRTVLVVMVLVVMPFSFNNIVFAAEKIGYVDLSRLFDEYNKTREYDALLSSKEKSYESERDKRVSEIKELQNKISLLSDKEKESKKTELEKKIKSLEDFDRQKQTELLRERDDKIKEILKDIEGAVRQYASSQGYTLVFNDRVLVYQSKDLDLTEKVLEILKSGSKVSK